MKTNKQLTTPFRRSESKVARLIAHPLNGRRSLLLNLRIERWKKSKEEKNQEKDETELFGTNRLREGNSLVRASSGYKRFWMANGREEEEKKEVKQRTVRGRRRKLNSGTDVCTPVPLLSSQQKVRCILMSLARSKKIPSSRKWALQCPECARRYQEQG